MAITNQEITPEYAIYNGDSCEVLPKIKAESVGFSIYSPPFSELYNYSSSDRDLSNCKDYDEFLTHYDFIVKEIARVTMPGRLSCIHCMDLKMGTDSYRDFPGDVVRLYQKHGFHLATKIVIWKEPYAVRMRTMIRGLAHKQVVEDSSLCNMANPDYIIVMRKGGTNMQPIRHPEGFTRYAGVFSPADRAKLGYMPIPDSALAYMGRTDVAPRANKWSHWIWRQYASSVWMDINPGRLLPYREARESEDEKHICPLQLDPIERCVTMWSNPGDVVLTPFLGIGSEAYMAVRLGRKAIGIELQPKYFRQAVKNMRLATEPEPDGDDFIGNIAEDGFPIEEDLLGSVEDDGPEE